MTTQIDCKIETLKNLLKCCDMLSLDPTSTKERLTELLTEKENNK